MRTNMGLTGRRASLVARTRRPSNAIRSHGLTVSMLLSLPLLVCSVSQAGLQPPPQDSPAMTEERTFRASDGSEEKYVLVYPKGFRVNQPVTLLITLHGHGSDRWQFIRDKRDECRAARDVAATHGLLLMSPDYRGKTSWMGPRAEADLIELLAKLKSRFRIKNVVLCGGSMGATGALTFTALHPAMIQGIVALNGTANLIDYTNFSDAIRQSFGGTRQEVPEEYRKRSAEFHPLQFTMPIAVTTGGMDRSVPPESVLRLLKEIRKNNLNVLSLHRPEVGHRTDYRDTRRALEFVITRLAAPAEESTDSGSKLEPGETTRESRDRESR